MSNLIVLHSFLIETGVANLVVPTFLDNSYSTTAIDVAQARGVIVLACETRGVKINEYTPLQVKQSVTGYGKAEKRQVMEMVKNLLGLKAVPKPDDTADALALAVCHGHSSASSVSKIIREEQRQ